MIITQIVKSPATTIIRRSFCSTCRMMDDETFRLNELLAKFKDPNSHYHIPPGTNGPIDENDHSTSRSPMLNIKSRGKSSSPPTKTSPKRHPLADWKPTHPGDEPSSNLLRGDEEGISPEILDQLLPSSLREDATSSVSLRRFKSSASTSTPTSNSPSESESSVREGNGLSLEERYDISRATAREYFEKEGYDTNGVLDVNVVWGEQDSFRHVNNVHYVRWIESARIAFCESFTKLPKNTIRNLLTGQGMGFILKDVAVKYRHPVTYPDTVHIASRIHDINQPRGYFKMGHAIWSLRDNKLAATGDSTLVMYDYDHLRKGTMSDEFKVALEARYKKPEE